MSALRAAVTPALGTAVALVLRAAEVLLAAAALEWWLLPEPPQCYSCHCLRATDSPQGAPAAVEGAASSSLEAVVKVAHVTR